MPKHPCESNLEYCEHGHIFDECMLPHMIDQKPVEREERVLSRCHQQYQPGCRTCDDKILYTGPAIGPGFIA